MNYKFIYQGPEFQIIETSQHINYEEAIQFMENQVNEIINNSALSTIWLLEHENCYTGGPLANKEDILNNNKKIPIYQSDRGGKYTYHGPGQRIIYFMLNLKKLKNIIQDNVTPSYLVKLLENIIINSLKKININSELDSKYPGVWVYNQKSQTKEKIAAIGLKIKQSVSYHGIALNINPNMEYYQHIIPCGIKEYGVTSVYNILKKETNFKILDQILIEEIKNLFLSNTQ